MHSGLRVAAATILAIPALALAQVQLPTKEPAQKPAPPPAPGTQGPVATVNGVAIPRQRADFVMRCSAKACRT